MHTWNWPRRCLSPPLSQRSCNHRYISLDILSISCLAILRIFALDGIPSSPSSSPIVVGIPSSRSRFVEFELDRDLFIVLSYIWKRCFNYPFQAGHPVPLPYQIKCKHLDYGLQHKIAIKPIFTLFFTNMVVESVWLRRMSGIIRRGDVGNKFSQVWHNKMVLESRVSYLTNQT